MNKYPPLLVRVSTPQFSHFLPFGIWCSGEGDWDGIKIKNRPEGGIPQGSPARVPGGEFWINSNGLIENVLIENVLIENGLIENGETGIRV